MRKLLTPANVVCVVIIAAVAAMITVANWRDIHRSRTMYTRPALTGTRGLGTSREHLDARVAELRTRLSAHPQDAGLAIMLADALLRQARTTGNAGLAIEAERSLKRALDGDVANYDANRLLAAVYLSQHRFREAIAVAEKNRNARPSDPINDGIIGDGHLELGDYEQAFDAFDRMVTSRPSAAAYARVAYARELQGNLAGAIEAMKLAADATAADDSESLAWHRSQVGDLYLRLGKVRDAEVEYTAASHAFPGHPFAVMGYAKVLVTRGDRTGALTLLQSLQRTAPTPDLAARIGDLYKQLGREADAEREFTLAEAGWRVDAPEPKNLARFLADHDRKIEEAVTIAETAAANRHDIFTEDALAWAYYKAGRVEDARRAIAQALRTGTRDADILAHAAAIRGARQVASR
ncbi:MAG: tetratricopeptide repeat protein [Acidobacteriota bacterium]